MTRSDVVASRVVRSSADSSEQRAPGVLAPSRLGGAAAVSSSRSVLRPSALTVPAASLKTPETNGLAGSTFTLHPPKFNNPFAAKGRRRGGAGRESRAVGVWWCAVVRCRAALSCVLLFVRLRW